jgi:putative membrane protein
MISRISMKRMWVCTVPALLTGAALLAQTPSTGGSQQPSMPSQPRSGQTAPAPGEAPGTAATGQSFSDQAFVAKALEGGAAEVQLGQLAEQKAQSNDVKQFAAKMVSEHQQMADKWLKPVAKQIGASEPKGPSKKDKKMMEKMQGLSGQQFDTEYIQMMVKDHRQDLKEFQNEAQMAQDPNVKQIAQQGADLIQKHLQMIEQIAQAHNVPVEGKTKEMSSK